MIIAAFIPNIFDRSRFGGDHGNDVVFVADATEIATVGPALVLVDLDRCPDPAAFVTEDRAYHTIGFGPHVEAEAHAAARAMGYDEVLPRSKFFRQLNQLLTKNPDIPDEP